MIPSTNTAVNQTPRPMWGSFLFPLAILLTAYLILGSPVTAGDTHPENSVGFYNRERNPRCGS